MDPKLAPAQTGTYGSKSRWDELLVSHVAQVQYIHVTVGAFFDKLCGDHRADRLSFFSFRAPSSHGIGGIPKSTRIFFETSVATLARTREIFQATYPHVSSNFLRRYWDEQADQASRPLQNATVWSTSSTSGFGTGNTDENDCVVDGAFANITYSLTTNLTQTADTCMKRVFNQTQFDSVSQTVVDSCMDIDDYWKMWACLGNTPHTGGHFGVGGTVCGLKAPIKYGADSNV